MHGLDIIIQRNDEAAGREAAHAFNDGDYTKAEAIHATHDTMTRAYGRAYLKARKEG